jgi:hypothetical protein
MCQRLLLEGLDSSLNEGSKNAARRLSRAIEFLTMELNTFGSPK